VSVCSGYKAVDIRRFWTPMNETVPKATRVGISLRLPEFEVLKTTMKKIEEHHPTIANFLPCYFQEDHSNQLGLFYCGECNPYHNPLGPQ